MAISRLAGQDAEGTSTTSTVSATYPGATTAGNLLICSLYAIVGQASVTGPSGFTAAKQEDFSAGAQSVSIFYKVADGTETTITSTGTAATQMRTHIYEYTGNANPVVVDQTNGNTSGVTSVTTIASGNITTTNASDLLFVALGTGGSTSAYSFTNSFNTRQSDVSASRLCDADQIVAVTGTYGTTASWTTSVRAGIAIAGFQAAATPGSVNSGFFNFM